MYDETQTKPRVLTLFKLSPPAQKAVAAEYELSETSLADIEKGPTLSGPLMVITNGDIGFSARAMDRCTHLRLVSSFGAGYENIDVGAASQRGIPVTNAPGANSATVADHALAMMLSLARQLMPIDAGVRAGRWNEVRGPQATVHGSVVGIVGLGSVGRGIARRAAAFDARVLYHTPRPHPDAPWEHVATPVELAMRSDFLVLACAGGPATRHLVNTEVLKALGPKGFLVNVSRGSVVDTNALLDALDKDAIAGCGLDVVDGEPAIPPRLLTSRKAILTPHMAGRSPRATKALVDILLENLHAGERGIASLYQVGKTT